jgi:hypothetical protein
MNVSNFIKLYEKKLKILNIKNSCQDKKFYLKKKNFFSAPYNYHFINFFLNSNKLDNKNKNFLLNGIKFILDNQNSNGSYDEWYKNEDSFCTSSYTAYLISKLYFFKKKELSYPLRKKILKSLEKSNSYLHNKNNFNNLNQQLAKLAFQIIYKKKIFNSVSDYKKLNNDFEYNGIDLGYLTVNLSILAEMFVIKKNKIFLNLFLKHFEIFRIITGNFNYFPSYLFSRSSKIFLYSGIFFASKIGLFPKKLNLVIQERVFMEIDYLIKQKNIKYLSFFYSTDLQILKLIQTFKSSLDLKNKFNLNQKISKDILAYKNKFYKFIFYKKNPNNFLIYKNNKYKYYFDYNVDSHFARLVPNINLKLKLHNKVIFIKNDFKKIYNTSIIKSFYNIISFLNTFFKLGKFIKLFGQNILIKGFNKKSIRNFKKISLGKKIIVQEKIIFKKSFFPTNPLILKDNKQLYFSPTSYIKLNEVGKIKLIKKKIINKDKFKIFLIEYECI